MYLRTPMGHSSASDAYTKRYDDAVVDIPRKFKCVDDVLLHDSSVEQAFWHCWDYLEACARARITLSPEKFCFCRKEVDFVGYRLGWKSYPRFLQIRLGSESCDQISASPNRPKRAKSRDETAGSLFTRVYTLVEFSQTKRCFFPFLKQNIQRQMIRQHHYHLHNTIHISLKTR